MTDQAEIEAKFWRAVETDRTMMVGLVGVEGAMAQPMTAQLDDGLGKRRGPIYFFTAKDTDLVQEMGERHRAIVNFAAKGHDLFATMEGDLLLHNDRTTIERLRRRFAAAWFENGKSDASRQLLRFQPRDAQIWLDGPGVFGGVKMLLGNDPKDEDAAKIAHLRF